MNRETPTTQRASTIAELSALLHGYDYGDVHGIPAFGTTDLDEIQLRETGALFTLLLLHKVDDRGRCRQCRPVLADKRRWAGWPTRKAPCQILRITRFFSTAPLEVVWLRLLPRLGIRRELDKIRANLTNKATATELAGTTPAPAEIGLSARDALRPNNMSA